jgi:hypothetical protein
METADMFCKATAARRALACGLIAAVAYAAILASSPSLHARLHSDAGQTQHQCAAVLLSKACENSPTTPACALPVFVSDRFILARIEQKAAPLCPSASRERAPPSI